MMNYVILRVAGERFDVDAVLARFPKVRASAEVWHRGDEGRPRSRGPLTTSGCSLDIADEETWESAWKLSRERLLRLSELLRASREAGAETHLDVGIDCGLPERYVAGIGLEADDLRFLVDLGLGFEVTVYPYDEEKFGPAPGAPTREP
jgi:hypothetical protein